MSTATVEGILQFTDERRDGQLRDPREPLRQINGSILVPWQIIAGMTGARLEFIPVTEDGFLDLDEYKKLLELKPKMVAFTHMSNVLGTINPAKEIIEAHGSTIVVDSQPGQGATFSFDLPIER